jgi:hypothetical protein
MTIFLTATNLLTSMKKLLRRIPALLTIILALSHFSVRANSYVVTNTLNSTSPGSLKWAMQEANSHPGPDTILFDIAGAPPHTIPVTGAHCLL